jgi:hypothetical protein
MAGRLPEHGRMEQAAYQNQAENYGLTGTGWLPELGQE